MKIKSIITAVTVLLGSAFAAETAIPKDYPLTTCVVSGDKLVGGEMTPFKVTYEGTDVWLCCKSCEKKFKLNAAKHAKTVKDAQAKK